MVRVIIVGSGMSGSAAAQALSRNPEVEVIMLEADNRRGGRIHTVDTGGYPIDLGASWLHETLVNPLFRSAIDAGVKLVYDDNLYQYYTQQGVIPLSSGAQAAQSDIVDQIALDFHAGKPQRREIGLKDYVDEYFSKAPLLTTEQRRLAALMMQRNEHWAAQPWEVMPAGEAAHDGLGRNAFVLDGMQSVLDLVWSRRVADRVQVELGAEVVSIRMADSGSDFIVETADSRNWVCDYVVCTIPLGGLKQVFNTMFNTLPLPLCKSITETDIAALGKVVFVFPYKFWDLEPDEMFVIPDSGANRPSPVSLVNVFHHWAPERGAILLALTGPPLTQCVEANPDEAFEKLRWALESVRKDKHEPVPTPINVKVTSWTQQTKFGGSYSARRLGQTYNEMVQPFIDGIGRLRFAGEHTVWDGAGCVHGAYASGLREAEWILQDMEEIDE